MVFHSLYRRWRRAAVFFPPCVSAQYVGGQFYTPGLAIISTPAPETQEHADSSLSIAISLSGQGNLTDFNPGSSSATGTGYDNLELYLVSATNNINLTVSTTLLQPSGGNVNNVHYIVPDCVPAGSYNLSLYETSRFTNVGIFVITQVPISIQNENPSGQACPGNSLQTQPQSDSPLSGSPWLETETNPVSRLGTGVATLASTTPVDSISPQGGASSSPAPSLPSPTTPLPLASAGVPNPPPNASSVTSVVVTTTKPVEESGKVSIVVQTVTVTTEISQSTESNNDGGGILFPISAVQRDGPRWTFLLFLFLFSLALI